LKLPRKPAMFNKFRDSSYILHNNKRI